MVEAGVQCLGDDGEPIDAFVVLAGHLPGVLVLVSQGGYRVDYSKTYIRIVKADRTWAEADVADKIDQVGRFFARLDTTRFETASDDELAERSEERRVGKEGGSRWSPD